MKTKTANLVPLIATGIVPTATLTSALVSPPALGATGDLDPSFGAVGRLGPILNGPAWSLLRSMTGRCSWPAALYYDFTITYRISSAA